MITLENHFEDRDAYVTLVTSLPDSERLFVAKRPPLSRVRLERRLMLLAPEDRQTLALIERVTSWSAYTLTTAEADILRRAHDVLAELESPSLRALVAERLDLRTAVAALRMRQRGEPAPAEPFGPSRLCAHIIANWADPTFGLETRLPFLREAAALMERQDPLGLERHLLNTAFMQLKRRAARHLFDFEAVVIYVLKWNIFDRWARSNAHLAVERFDALTRDALARAHDIVPEGAR